MLNVDCFQLTSWGNKFSYLCTRTLYNTKQIKAGHSNCHHF